MAHIVDIFNMECINNEEIISTIIVTKYHW